MNIFYNLMNVILPNSIKEEVLGDFYEAYYRLKVQGQLTFKSKFALGLRGVLVILGYYQTLIQEYLLNKTNINNEEIDLRLRKTIYASSKINNENHQIITHKKIKLNNWINQKLVKPISISSETNNEDDQRRQPIKLSVITQFFPPDYAATGQLIEELVKHLGQQGVNIEVFTSQPGYAFSSQTAPCVEYVERIKIQRSRTAQLWPGRICGKAVNGVLYTLRALLYLLRAWRRNNILLVTTAPPFLPFVGYLANLLFKLPYVCIIYDLYPDIAIALGVVAKKHWVVRLWQGINKLVWLNAKGIIVLSPAMKQRVVAHCPQVDHKISVIHSWANPELIVPIAKQENWFAWKYNLVNKFTVLYFGNMGRCHDIDTMLKAAIELQDEPIQFVCIGGGAKRDELIQEVQQLGLNNFTFLPYQDKEVLPYSLTACDLSLVSINPSSESLVVPSKLYSALAAGRPLALVCSPHSDFRKLVAEANCGATFDNGDAYGLAQFIRLLNRDQELAEHLGKAGRQYMESHFTPKVISQQYLDILRTAIISEDENTPYVRWGSKKERETTR